MSKRIIVVALAALCAVAMSAVVASGASAAETTAYTCVETEPGKGEFENPHCDANIPGSGKNWKHVAIPPEETTQLTIAQIGENPVLGSTIALASVELEGTSTTECVACHFTNNTKEAGKPETMRVSGSGGTLKFTGVIVKGMTAKCEIKQGATTGTIETKPLKFETTGTAEAKIEPVTPEVLAEFEIAAVTGQKCNLKGSYKVTGFAVGTTTGSTLHINEPLSSGHLKLSGEPASLKGTGTLTGGPTGAEHHPLALT